MTWEIVSKRVRGTAMFLKEKEFNAITIHDPSVYVRFDKTEYDPRAGKEIHGKAYDSPEEAIEEIGAKVVERVLRDSEKVDGVHVNISLPKWVEE